MKARNEKVNFTIQNENMFGNQSGLVVVVP